MRLVEILRQPSPYERDSIVGFIDDMTSDSGVRPLSDHLWLDLNADRRVGFIGVIVRDEHHVLAYAQMSRGNDSHSLEVALRPGLVDARRIHDDAVATAIDSFRLDGGGQLSWWVDDPSQADHDLADHHGLSPVRRLLEMRMSLPARDQAEIETRSFVPGNDDLAWIVVNNRAFDGHSEQGAWTTETLQSRIAAPWFDPEGFRLHEQAGRIVGFCWTKVHHLDNTVIGEIYAIGVDPDFRGRRLGQQLTLAGLDSISGRGVHDVKLFVDASNTAALSMYDSLGFTMHSSRDAFAGTI